MSLSVLHIDAKPARAAQVLAGLQMAGHAVVVIEDQGQDLAKVVADCRPDVVTVGADGADPALSARLTTLLREHPCAVAVFLDQASPSDIIEAGLIGYVVDSFDPDSLENAVLYALSRFKSLEGLKAMSQEIRSAMGDRAATERAIRIFMAQMGLSREETVIRLQRLAKAQGVKVANLAARMVTADRMLKAG